MCQVPVEDEEEELMREGLAEVRSSFGTWQRAICLVSARLKITFCSTRRNMLMFN